MTDRLRWLTSTDETPLVASCVVLYGLEFIHPFADGTGCSARYALSAVNVKRIVFS